MKQGIDVAYSSGQSLSWNYGSKSWQNYVVTPR